MSAPRNTFVEHGTSHRSTRSITAIPPQRLTSNNGPEREDHPVRPIHSLDKSDVPIPISSLYQTDNNSFSKTLRPHSQCEVAYIPCSENDGYSDMEEIVDQYATPSPPPLQFFLHQRPNVGLYATLNKSHLTAEPGNKSVSMFSSPRPGFTRHKASFSTPIQRYDRTLSTHKKQISLSSMRTLPEPRLSNGFRAPEYRSSPLDRVSRTLPLNEWVVAGAPLQETTVRHSHSVLVQDRRIKFKSLTIVSDVERIVGREVEDDKPYSSRHKATIGPAYSKNKISSHHSESEKQPLGALRVVSPVEVFSYAPAWPRERWTSTTSSTQISTGSAKRAVEYTTSVQTESLSLRAGPSTVSNRLPVSLAESYNEPNPIKLFRPYKPVGSTTYQGLTYSAIVRIVGFWLSCAVCRIIIRPTFTTETVEANRIATELSLAMVLALFTCTGAHLSLGGRRFLKSV